VKNSRGSQQGIHTSGRQPQSPSSDPYHLHYGERDDVARAPGGRDSDRRSRNAELALRTGEASSDSAVSLR
jgi:hypothetical protein